MYPESDHKYLMVVFMHTWVVSVGNNNPSQNISFTCFKNFQAILILIKIAFGQDGFQNNILVVETVQTPF